MDAQNDAGALLNLATSKGLISQKCAVEFKQQIESGVYPNEARPISEILIKAGHVTAPQVDLLLEEFIKSQGPKIIGGHQLVAQLGQGGMGTVFKAIQLSMQREVALKLLKPALANDEEFVERFMREARAAAKVVHPHVVAVYDVGIDNGLPYMSLELVSGGDALGRLHAHGAWLPEREGVAIIRDAALGLAAINKAGLIHRDIKPANIFLAEDGRAKLADLGLARNASGDDGMTQTGHAVGSPAYMSPEQARGIKDLDIRTDIYALGASLYHLLVGHPPFSGATAFATVTKVINDPVPDPRADNPALSLAVSTVIRKSLNKDRNQRQQTPEDLVAELEGALAGKAPSARSGPMRAARASATSAPRLIRRVRRATSPSRSVAITAAVVVVLVVVGWRMSGTSSRKPAQSVSPSSESTRTPVVPADSVMAKPEANLPVQPAPDARQASVPVIQPPLGSVSGTWIDTLRVAELDGFFSSSSGEYIYVQPGIVLPAGRVARLRVYLHRNTFGNRVKLGLYRGSALVASAMGGVGMIGNDYWMELDTSERPVIAAGTYTISLNFQGNGDDFQFGVKASPPTKAGYVNWSTKSSLLMENVLPPRDTEFAPETLSAPAGPKSIAVGALVVPEPASR